MARTELVTRVFQVDELVGGVAGGWTGDALINFIMDNVEPTSWKKNGGPGTITFYAPGRALIIRNTAEVINKLGSKGF